MKPGDLVRYKVWPHEELHNSGMVGVVLKGPYPYSVYEGNEQWQSTQVDVWWDRPRSAAWGNEYISWEYEDELEVVNAVD